MSQPQWQFVANMGDADPITYGGLFVYQDATGVYAPEMEHLEPPADNIDLDDPKARWTVSRVLLERCYYTDGVLSDNKFHKDHPAWFASDLDSVCSSMDVDKDFLIALLTSDDPRQLAEGYRCLAEHHGYYQFDQEPFTLTRKEAERRYKHDGNPLVKYLKAITHGPLLSRTNHNAVKRGHGSEEQMALWNALKDSRGEEKAEAQVNAWIEKPWTLPRC